MFAGARRLKKYGDREESESVLEFVGELLEWVLLHYVSCRVYDVIVVKNTDM